MNKSTSLLELSNVTAGYGQSPVLLDVNLSVNQGELVCLLGRNGVGKTTLLRSIMGLNPLTSGSIIFDADDISKTPTFKRVKYGIAYIPQGREIMPYLSVEDNLKLGLAGSGKKGKSIPKEIFDFFPMLRDNLSRKGGLLSGGQQQQLAIARGLMANPKLMLFDEPTEGIQPSIVQEIEQTLKRINEEKGITVVVVEQKIDFVRQLAQRFFMMEKGKIVARGKSEELTDSLVNQYLAV